VSFINSPESLVTEAIDGLVMSQPGLCRLDGYPEVKVVVRSDWIQPRNAHKVAVISGGGAGHEPAHVGFVGEGMLTAAVSGDVFSSPSAYAVLAAIRSVAYPGGELQRRARKSPGVLLVVKNYTGDRINFTIAAEQARAEGIPVSMVVVGDDCAIPREKGVTGRRGIAGTCFVHKIAGAAAEAGRSLEAVTEEAKSAAGCIASVGVSASVCHIPGRRESKRIKPGKLEMGLGIHGEPGTKTVPKEPVARLVKDMRKLILNSSPERSYMSLKGEDRVAVIVNSLGSATPMEISIATKEIMRDLRSMGVVIERVVTGPLMTSMDMAGFSMSILKLPAEKLPRETMLLRLDAHTNAPGWPRGGGALTEHNAYGNIYPLEPETRKTWYRPAHLNASGKTMERIINNAALALYNSERELTEWDLKVGDGDCGTTFKLGAKAALHDLSGYPLNSISDTLEAMGSTVAKSMGGTSGALYRIFLLSLCATTRAKEIDNMIGDAKMDDQAKLKAISDAFSIAVEKLSTSGGAAEGDRTMLDALIPAARSLQGSVDTGAPLIAALEKAVAAAEVRGRWRLADNPSPSQRAITC